MIDTKTGRIAFHSYVFTEDGGLDFIQYGFDGEVLEKIVVRRPIKFFVDCENA